MQQSDEDRGPPGVAPHEQVVQTPDAEARSGTSIVSMFAGCGGLDLGFLGGFNYRGTSYPRLPTTIVAAYDNDKKAKRTYDRNFAHEQELIDLSMADVRKMPAAEVLIGGFPCQEFSFCGPRGGVEADRGSLFRVMSRYARVHQPLVVVCENVDGLRLINEGAALRTIRRSLTRAGYAVSVWPVYAPDYGVPQTRRRIFIVGTRKDLPALYAPEPQFVDSHRSTHWAIGDLVRVTTEAVPNQSQYFRAALAKAGHGQGDERNAKDAPAYTIRANGKSRVQFHYSLPRRLTVRECARLQTFPDNFFFPDEPTPSVRQIGNAVPPVLAYAIAKRVTQYAMAHRGDWGAERGGKKAQDFQGDERC